MAATPSGASVPASSAAPSSARRRERARAGARRRRTDCPPSPGRSSLRRSRPASRPAPAAHDATPSVSGAGPEHLRGGVGHQTREQRVARGATGRVATTSATGTLGGAPGSRGTEATLVRPLRVVDEERQRLLVGEVAPARRARGAAGTRPPRPAAGLRRVEDGPGQGRGPRRTASRAAPARHPPPPARAAAGPLRRARPTRAHRPGQRGPACRSCARAPERRSEGSSSRSLAAPPRPRARPSRGSRQRLGQEGGLALALMQVVDPLGPMTFLAAERGLERVDVVGPEDHAVPRGDVDEVEVHPGPRDPAGQVREHARDGPRRRPRRPRARA